MTNPSAQHMVLASRPKGKVTETDFRLERTEVPKPEPGQLLLRTQYLSLDPYMRWRMDDAKSYAAATALGEVMPDESSPTSPIPNIQLRQGRDRPGADGVADPLPLQRQGCPQDQSGRCSCDNTARGARHAGLHRLCRHADHRSVEARRNRRGLRGKRTCRVAGRPAGPPRQPRAVGIAGGPEKCAFVRGELGFDVAVDHRAPDFADRVADACPNGIDVYFENVGGVIFQTVAPLLTKFARVPVCGLIGQAGATDSLDPTGYRGSCGTS